MKEPIKPKPNQRQHRIEMVYKALDRLGEIGEDEADSELAYQAKKVLTEIEKYLRNGQR